MPQERPRNLTRLCVFALFAPLRENYSLARRRLLSLFLRGGFDQ